MRSCEIYVHGIKAGILTENSRRDFTFIYDSEYLHGHNEAVSLTLPLREEAFHSECLFPIFANMLSEGENRQIQSQLLRIDPEDDFGFLLATCRFDTIGAVTVKPIEL